MGETGETLEPQDQRGQGSILHQVLELQARGCQTEANRLAGIHGEKKKQPGKHRAYYGR